MFASADIILTSRKVLLFPRVRLITTKSEHTSTTTTPTEEYIEYIVITHLFCQEPLEDKVYGADSFYEAALFFANIFRRKCSMSSGCEGVGLFIIFLHSDTIGSKYK